jgi:acetyl esterase
VQVKSAVDLPPGHLDPWVAEFERQRASAQPRPSFTSRLRGIGGLFVARDKRLLEGRAQLEAHMSAEDYCRDLTSGDVAITRTEWTLAGEVRAVWRYERTPSRSSPRPALLHLHGGGFSAGTPTGRDPLLMLIADRSDAVIFDLDYSMIPERTFPQPVLEAAAAVATLHQQAAAWDIDPSRLAIAGGSAGGNIAAATALMLRDEGVHNLALQVLYSPFLSFGRRQPHLSFTPVHVVPEHRQLAGPQSLRAMGVLLQLLYRAYRGDGRRDDPYMSPALAASFTNLPKSLVIGSEMDPLHRLAEHFAGDLARAGVPVRTVRFRGCKHESPALVGHVPQAEATALEIVAAMEALSSDT